MERHGIELDGAAVERICRAHDVESLHVFGSLLRDDFTPESDVDFLVRLRPGIRPSIERLFALENDLEGLVRRPVDIVLGSEIDGPGANPFRRRQILETMEPLYVA